MNPISVITVDELRNRLSLPSRRRACAVMREMTHRARGRDLWTTEEWFAAWITAKAVKREWKSEKYDPLEDAVMRRVVSEIGRLAALGVIRVYPTEGKAA